MCDYEHKPFTSVGDDWADVGAEAALPIRSQSEGAGKAEVSRLAPASDIPRPEMVLGQPPYRLIVDASGRQLWIQCSHSPSLELLATYIRPWCRTDHTLTNNVK